MDGLGYTKAAFISLGPVIGVLPFRFAVWRRNEKVLGTEKAFSDEGLLQLPWRSFWADVLAWVAAGGAMVIIYYGFFLPYASTSIKVLGGCTALGIFSGMVLAGNVGSQSRLSYALVGDTVNLASRVQVLNKTCGTDILLTRATCNRLAENKDKVLRVGRFSVKGKRDKVEVFTITTDDEKPTGVI